MAAEQSNDVEAFIKHWSAAPVSERSQYQTFIIQLCRLIGVPAPDDVRAGDLDYCFERPVQFRHDDGSTTAGRIDCAKLGCFVLEAKQSDKRRDGGPMDTAAQLALLGRSSKRGFSPSPHAVDRVMRVAKRQAENYAKALAEWPPFLITVDVGRSIELWSDFARQGKIYAPFPDRAGYRITLDQLRAPEVRERLRRVWTDPMSLDPAARSAAVTTEIATSLAWLVKSINGRRQSGLGPVDRAAQASKTARFVMQCIFAMFADSVGLIERRSFLGLLESYRGEAERFHQGARSLFRAMDQGGYCVATRQPIHRFNGGLYSTVETLPIEEGELAALIAAAKCDWTDVEPAIFGTLLEQALDPAERNFRTIRQADALLEFSRVEVVHQRDQAERETVRYVDPRPMPWPEVDFIVGNPPFIGGKGLRRELGDGYVDALAAIRDRRFLSADLVMAWWDRAAEILARPDTLLRRFGFITTNSITQTFSRRVIAHHLAKRPPIRIVFAIADHPWARGAGCADVRIAMSVAERGEPDGQGRWLRVKDADTKTFEERHGDIGPDLMLDSRLTRIRQLKANAVLAYRGVQLMGAGFQVTPAKAKHLLAGSDPQAPSPVRDYRNGRDLADRSRGLQVIDLFGWDEGEARRRHPLLFQHLLETVKPDRDRNNRAAYRDNWWIFGEPRRDLRDALEGLSRFIVTIETAKHRWFRFMDAATLPDNKLVVIASDDPFVLGVLSSRQHRAWFAANAGRIGEYEREAVYVKGACFDTFPFPDAGAALAAEIGVLAEELDAVRAGVLRGRDALTMTGLYNARARIGLGDRVSDAERAIHDQGRVGIIDHLHQRLDQLVAKAYGWPDDLADSQIVERLLQLNQARAQQEEQGDIRFLRPAYQAGKVRQGVARPPQPLLRHRRKRRCCPSNLASWRRPCFQSFADRGFRCRRPS
jgi:hypothetical protein